MANRFKKNTNAFKYPTVKGSLVMVHKDKVSIPAELERVIGYINNFLSHLYNSRSKASLKKAAGFVRYINYEEVTTSKVRDIKGWISVHMDIPKNELPKAVMLRNEISKLISFNNKPYEWSGIILKSNQPGCNARFSIGPKSKNYGIGGTPYALGYKYTSKLECKF